MHCVAFRLKTFFLSNYGKSPMTSIFTCKNYMCCDLTKSYKKGHLNFLVNISHNYLFVYILETIQRKKNENKKIWRSRGSNPGLFACKANTLPLSYIPTWVILVNFAPYSCVKRYFQIKTTILGYTIEYFYLIIVIKPCNCRQQIQHHILVDLVW